MWPAINHGRGGPLRRDSNSNHEDTAFLFAFWRPGRSHSSLAEVGTVDDGPRTRTSARCVCRCTQHRRACWCRAACWILIDAHRDDTIAIRVVDSVKSRAVLSIERSRPPTHGTHGGQQQRIQLELRRSGLVAEHVAELARPPDCMPPRRYRPTRHCAGAPERQGCRLERHHFRLERRSRVSGDQQRKSQHEQRRRGDEQHGALLGCRVGRDEPARLLPAPAGTDLRFATRDLVASAREIARSRDEVSQQLPPPLLLSAGRALLLPACALSILSDDCLEGVKGGEGKRGGRKRTGGGRKRQLRVGDGA